MNVLISCIVMNVLSYCAHYSMYIPEWTGASWRERKCPNFETAAKGILTQALSIETLAFYRWSTKDDPLSIETLAFYRWSTKDDPLSIETLAFCRWSTKDDPRLTQSIGLTVVCVSVFQTSLLPGMGRPWSSNHVLGVRLLLHAVILHR